jgi:hypothetical protein
VDRPPWIALVLQDIADRQAQLPWRAAELQQVAALDRLADALTPAPVPVPSVGERLGAEFTDLVLFAPSVGLQGGPQPAELITSSRSGGAASPHAVTALVCALAGYLTESSLRPPPPGLPTIRAFQAAHATIARHWLTERL